LALWKQSRFSGTNHPQQGEISRLDLKTKLSDLGFQLPDEDSTASAKQFADAMKVQSLGSISKMVGAKRPSNADYEVQQKKQKRADKEEEKVIKKLVNRADQRMSNMSRNKSTLKQKKIHEAKQQKGTTVIQKQDPKQLASENSKFLLY